MESLTACQKLVGKIGNALDPTEGAVCGRMGRTSDYKLIHHSLHDIMQTYHAKLAWSSTEGCQL